MRIICKVDYEIRYYETEEGANEGQPPYRTDVGVETYAGWEKPADVVEKFMKKHNLEWFQYPAPTSHDFYIDKNGHYLWTESGEERQLHMSGDIVFHVKAPDGYYIGEVTLN